MRLAVLLLLVLGLLGCEALYGGLSGHNPGYCRGCTADQVCNDKGFCVSADGGAADADGGPPAMRVELLPVSVDNLKPNLRALTMINEDEVWIGGASNAVVRVSRPVSGGAYKLDNFAGVLGLTSETVAMASNAASVGLLFRSGGYLFLERATVAPVLAGSLGPETITGGALVLPERTLFTAGASLRRLRAGILETVLTAQFGFSTVVVANADEGVAVGPKGLIQTIGPADAQPITATSEDLLAVDQVPSGTVVAVGANAALVRLDASKVTQNLREPGGPTLRGVWINRPEDVWVVGDGGTVRRYNQQGYVSFPLPQGVNANLYAVKGVRTVNGPLVFAVGDQGTVLRIQ